MIKAEIKDDRTTQKQIDILNKLKKVLNKRTKIPSNKFDAQALITELIGQAKEESGRSCFYEEDDWFGIDEQGFFR